MTSAMVGLGNLASVNPLNSSSHVRVSGIPMSASRDKRATVVAPRSTIAERVCAFLRSVHPTKTAENVAADIGISPRTIRALFERDSAPGAVAFAAMVSAYGPEFVAAVVPGCGWAAAAAREARREKIAAEIAALQSEIEALSGERAE